MLWAFMAVVINFSKRKKYHDKSFLFENCVVRCMDLYFDGVSDAGLKQVNQAPALSKYNYAPELISARYRIGL